jgi:hypothetical protein
MTKRENSDYVLIKAACSVGKDYFYDDLIDPKMLLFAFYEILDHEAYFTSAGMSFLEEYYGWNNGMHPFLRTLYSR